MVSSPEDISTSVNTKYFNVLSPNIDSSTTSLTVYKMKKNNIICSMEGKKWTKAQTCAVSERYKMALWGPVLLCDNHNNLLWIFYSESTTAQEKPPSNTSSVGGNILYKTSNDYGITCSNWTEILRYNIYCHFAF